MNSQAVKFPRPDASLWVASWLLMAFLFSSCGEKKNASWSSLIHEQTTTYAQLSQVLDQIAQEGVSAESDEMLLKLGHDIKGLKDQLLLAPQPEQEDMTAFLATDESLRYQQNVTEVAEKYHKLKSSGKGSDAIDRAFEKIGIRH